MRKVDAIMEAADTYARESMLGNEYDNDRAIASARKALLATVMGAMRLPEPPKED